MHLSTSTHDLIRLKRAYNGWINSRGADATLFLDLMAENFQYISGLGTNRPGYFRMHNSRAGMEEYFFNLHRDWEMLHYMPEEFVAQGHSIVMRGQCSFRFRANGRVSETIDLNWWHFEAGKAVALFHGFDSASMVATTQGEPAFDTP